MTVICLGALLAGLVAAPLMPFLPFACAAVAVAMVVAAALKIVTGFAVARAAVSAVAILFTNQIGYGLGTLVIAFVAHARAAMRRSGPEKQGAHRVRTLHVGNEPR